MNVPDKITERIDWFGLADGFAARQARRDAEIGEGDCGDYRENGILMCGKCRTPRQEWRNLPVYPTHIDDDGILVRERRLAVIDCKCRAEAKAREAEQNKDWDFGLWMDTHRQYGISGGLAKDVTFEADDGRDPMATEICRRYVEKWREMRENNIGVIFYGPNGTGKSFHAGMIVNALLKKRVRCLVTSFPTILSAMEKWGEKQEIVNYLGLFDLLAVDDLGAERDNDYATEQVYHIIDARYRQGKPLIVTTNFPRGFIQDTNDIRLKRIFDRLLEMCPLTITLTGPDRRTELAERKKRLAGAVLKGVG